MLDWNLSCLGCAFWCQAGLCIRAPVWNNWWKHSPFPRLLLRSVYWITCFYPTPVPSSNSGSSLLSLLCPSLPNPLKVSFSFSHSMAGLNPCKSVLVPELGDTVGEHLMLWDHADADLATGPVLLEIVSSDSGGSDPVLLKMLVLSGFLQLKGCWWVLQPIFLTAGRWKGFFDKK